jgi:hypothetical protein
LLQGQSQIVNAHSSGQGRDCGGCEREEMKRRTLFDTKQKLISVLRETRDYLARPDNDFAWSSWQDAPAALREVDGLISCIESGNLPNRSDITFLFLPTGLIQEVSVSNGWGQEFLELASRLDAAVERAYGVQTSN